MATRADTPENRREITRSVRNLRDDLDLIIEKLESGKPVERTELRFGVENAGEGLMRLYGTYDLIVGTRSS